MFSDIAYAAGGAAQGGLNDFLGGPLPPFIIVIFIMYFLIFRPQQKKAKEHRTMIDNLKKGDRVITSGGIHGRVTSVDDGTATVEIADKVRVKVVRGNIAAVVSNQPVAKKEDKKKS